MTEQERLALDAGVSITTRLSRTFNWVDSQGQATGFRHTMHPSLSFGHLYQVGGMPSDFHQFDSIDRLNENSLIRLGLLNRFQALESTPDSPSDDPGNPWADTVRHSESLFIDLAQNFIPISERDNAGQRLGLLEYELIWRPFVGPDLRLLFEGEHDWNTDQARTMNAAIRLDRVLGVNWTAGYRTDHMVRGAIQYGAATNLLGRWTLQGRGAYDLQTEQALDYHAFLTRRDHDWVIRVGVSFSQIRDETSVTVDFQPLFGGLFRPRSDDFAGMYGRGPDAILY
jgi:hypothetical protein